MQNFLKSKNYWFFYLLFSLFLEIVALFYQYFLDYYPCVLCIHVRIILLAMMLLSITTFIFYSKIYLRIVSHIFLLLLLFLLVDRSYNLLGVERGFVLGDCSMNSGLPTWFAIDQWLPSVFKIWEPCGYTPEILFGITMAESLMVLSIVLAAIGIKAFLLELKSVKNV